MPANWINRRRVTATPCLGRMGDYNVSDRSWLWAVAFSGSVVGKESSAVPFSLSQARGLLLGSVPARQLVQEWPEWPQAEARSGGLRWRPWLWSAARLREQSHGAYWHSRLGAKRWPSKSGRLLCAWTGGSSGVRETGSEVLGGSVCCKVREPSRQPGNGPAAG